jgi:hypothetical protein
MMDIFNIRRLVHFPDYTPEDQAITILDLLRELRKPARKGFLIHGGPGNGKSEILAHISRQVNSEDDMLCVGPIIMNQFRSITDSERILQNVVQRMYKTVSTRLPDFPPVATGFRHMTVEDLFDLIRHLVDALVQARITRLVLLLDDYDKMDTLSAETFSSHLRAIFDTHKTVFCFVLVSSVYLPELHYTRHVYSLLRDVTDSQLLLPFSRAEGAQYIQELAQERSIELSADDVLEIFDATEGYPALLVGVLNNLAEQRKANPELPLEQVFTRVLDRYYDYEPFHSVCSTIERLTVFGETYSPAQVIQNLRSGAKLDSNDEGVRILLAMGVLRWHGKHLGWYSRLVQEFWTSGKAVGRQLLAGWLHRPTSFSRGVLKAQGVVYVCLLLDLEDLVAVDDKKWGAGLADGLTQLRGQPDYVQALTAFGKQFVPQQDGGFQLWESQSDLYSLAHELNLLRQQVIRESITPIFEANTEHLKLDFESHLNVVRPGLPEEKHKAYLKNLHQEWAHWTRVQLHLTRSGAIAITLIRDVPDATPLIQIMNELLGLESELTQDEGDGGQEPLSVQWELSLAVFAAFFDQAAQENGAGVNPLRNLGLSRKPWNEYADGHVYPEQRDRYVIYEFMKLCDCNSEDKANHILKAADIEPILTDSPSKTIVWERAYNYARELAGVMEAVMISHEEDGAKSSSFPQIKVKDLRELFNLEFSSWEDELLIISLDNALIVFSSLENLEDPPANGKNIPKSAEQNVICRVCKHEWRRKIGKLYFPGRSVPYQDYWHCISLGLQYLLQLRWTAKWITGKTTHDLGQIAKWMKLDVNDSQRRSEMRALEDRVALYTRLLSHLRDATNPLLLATADYAVRKYEQFIKVSYLHQVIESAEKDIEAIHAFLDRDQDLYKEYQAEKLRNVLEKVGIFATILSILLVIPSFWIDFEQSTLASMLLKIALPEKDPVRAGILIRIITGALSVILVLFVLWVLYTIRTLNAQNKQKPKRRD